MARKFQDLDGFTEDDVESALRRNDPDELQLVPVTAAVVSQDLELAQDICIRLSTHEHHTVRGNAVMSFGHLARRFRKLDERKVRPLIESALNDPHEYVRVLAKSAADEIHQFLEWEIAGHIYG